MKRANIEKLKALSVITHPMISKMFKSQLVEKSLILGALTRLIRDKKILRHTKCEKRINVLESQDYLVASTLGQDIEGKIKNGHKGCPFLQDGSCVLIRDGLTAPTLCVKRIVAENPSLESVIKRKLQSATHFLVQSIRLIGARI